MTKDDAHLFLDFLLDMKYRGDFHLFLEGGGIKGYEVAMNQHNAPILYLFLEKIKNKDSKV